MLSAVFYTFIPVGAAVIGAAVAAARAPSPGVTSAVQHFAAGVVFAAAAAELLPELIETGGVRSTLVGALLGIALMLAVKALARRARAEWSMLAIIGVDIFIDGLVLGIGFASGERQGRLLTFALTIEILFLGLSVSGAASRLAGTPLRTTALTALIALLLPLGAMVGLPVAASSPALLNGLFAFGLMALLYLVTEELLVEAHEVEERPWVTAMFFLGFLLLVVVEEIA